MGADGAPCEHPDDYPCQPGDPAEYCIGVNDNFDEEKIVNGEPREDWEDESIIGTDSQAKFPIPISWMIESDPWGDGEWDHLMCGSTFGDRVSAKLGVSAGNIVRLWVFHDEQYVHPPLGQDLFPDYYYGQNTLYVEGVQPGTVTMSLDGLIDGDYSRRRIDKIRVHAVKIDADVDSDNTKTTAPFGPDGSIQEDRIEDSANLPGRIILVNDDDDDNDGVADYGDGYNLNTDDFVQQDNANPSEDDFIEMKLKVPAPVDLGVARIRVTYDASNPASATYDYGSPPEAPPITLTPAAGLLRIWTKRGDESRHVNSLDYVTPSPDVHPASDFGLSNTVREVSLWLEGINPGQTRVVFELDPDGDTGPAEFVHSDAFQVTVLKVTLVNPTGPSWVYDSMMGRKTPRIMTPVNAQGLNGNEFTYSSAYPDGVLTLPVYISIQPDTEQIQTLFQNKIRTRVSPINDSHSSHENVQLAWDHPFPGESTAGVAVYSAPLPLWQATATFTKLPPENQDFGLKTLTVQFLGAAGNIVCSPRTRDYEIFYPIEATNHPDLPGKDDWGNFSATSIDTAGHGDSTRSQNWFFYWNRTPAGDPNARFYSSYADWRTDDSDACTPAGSHWLTYTGPRERTVFHPSYSRDLDIRLDGSNKPISGIDKFANVVLHENRHVLQILEHNALDPYDVSLNGARIGWATTGMPGVIVRRTRPFIALGLYNHFRAGPDGKPGKADEDDDDDTEIDEKDEFIAGPPDPAIPGDAGSVKEGTDDEDLDRDGDHISHLVPTDPDPDPNVFDSELWEIQAKDRETSPQDTFREYDWGDPGKQHGPDLDTLNDRLEMNSYAD